MPNEYDDDIIIPDGFNVETGKWEDEEVEEQPAEETPTIENQEAETEQPAEETPTIENQEAETEQPAEETDTEAPAEDTTIIPPAPEPVIPQTLKVKYNHEDRELTLDEAAIYAQKGMNYDKLEERVKGFEASNARTEQLARSLGYESAEEMMEAAEKNFIERQVKELVDAGNTEAMARFLVEQKMAKAAASVPKVQPQEQPTPTAEVKPAPQQNPNGITKEREAELREFVQAYPGVTKLPDEVINENRKGVRLLVAYERYQNKAALNELAILKQNQAAANKAPVTGVVGKAGATNKQQNPDNDPFLKGFDSDSW